MAPAGNSTPENFDQHVCNASRYPVSMLRAPFTDTCPSGKISGRTSAIRRIHHENSGFVRRTVCFRDGFNCTRRGRQRRRYQMWEQSNLRPRPGGRQLRANCGSSRRLPGWHPPAVMQTFFSDYAWLTQPCCNQRQPTRSKILTASGLLVPSTLTLISSMFRLPQESSTGFFSTPSTAGNSWLLSAKIC